MAKITVAGQAVVVTSEMKLEDLKTIKKYRPEALTLFQEDENGGKDPIFGIGVGKGCGDINKYGAEFGSASRDDAKKAQITMCLPEGVENVKEYISDTLGAALLKLNRLEATLPTVIEEIEAEKQQIAANITIAQ